jgi:very-short-patch-repair endonuclease
MAMAMEKRLGKAIANQSSTISQHPRAIELKFPLPRGEDVPKGQVRGLVKAKCLVGMTNRLTQIARGLRRRQTEEERRLWARLRDRRLNGLKFRRQAPCGRFIADFLCDDAMLIIELDGSQHAEPSNMIADAARAEQLRVLGYEVVRVWNGDIRTNIDGVLDEILDNATRRLSPSSAPSGHLLP